VTHLPVITRAVRAERAIFAALGLIVLVTSFLVAAIPSLLTSRYDAAAREAAARPAPAARDVTVTILNASRASPQAATRLDIGLRQAAAEFDHLTPDELRAVSGRFEYSVATGAAPLPIRAGGNPGLPDQSRRLLLQWDPGVASRVRYVGGRPPRNPLPRAPGRPPVIEVGLDATSAAALRVRAGAELPLVFGTGPVVVRVTGVYRPVAAGDRYWPSRAGLTGPIVSRDKEGPIYTGVGVLDAAGYEAAYAQTDASLYYTWRRPVRPELVTASRVGAVVDALTRFGLAGAERSVRVESGLTPALTEFRGQLRTAQAVLSLALTGLFAVAFGVLALVCRLLTERLRTPLATMRARGASLAQLGAGVGGAALGVALPAAAAGYGSAALVPGPAAAAPGAVAVLAAATLLPVALVGWAHGRASRPGLDGLAGRSDLVGGRVTPRRLVLEGLAVVLAGAGVFVLRTRGLAADAAASGSDPFLTMVPVLLGCAAGLLTLRGYPYPLRLVARLTARGRSAVSFVGVARASRQGTVAVLPMIVLLLAMTVAGFAAVIDSGLREAQERSAWMTAGAEARVDGLRLDVDGAERIRRVPGVRDATPVRFVENAAISAAGQAADVTVVAIDLAAYRRVVAGTPIRLPAPPPAAGPAVPALLSPGLAGRLGPGPHTATAAGIAELTVRPAGTIDAFPGARDAFVVVPYRALGPNAVPAAFFVSGADPDQAALRRAAGGDAVVTTRAAVYERLTGAPMVTLVRTSFGVGALVVAGYATLAILLALIIGSSGRGQTVSYLRTLGLSRAQARRLAITEVGPALACAAVAGWVVGTLLPQLVGPAIDLRPYTGGIPATGFAPDPLTTAALAAGLVAFGGLAIAADAMISSRRRLGSTLRMGAQP
jgi:putative ABC transport system permease protein